MSCQECVMKNLSGIVALLSHPYSTNISPKMQKRPEPCFRSAQDAVLIVMFRALEIVLALCGCELHLRGDGDRLRVDICKAARKVQDCQPLHFVRFWIQAHHQIIADFLRFLFSVRIPFGKI